MFLFFLEIVVSYCEIEINNIRKHMTRLDTIAQRYC